MDFYLMNEENLPQAARLWDICFEKQQEPFFQWYFSQYCLRQNKIIGGFRSKEHLCTMLHLNPFTVRRQERLIEAPYIVGVATDPEDRGRHLLHGLMETTFALLRAQGIMLTMLQPINEIIYRPFGFALSAFRLRYELSLAELPSAGAAHNSYAVKRLTKLTEKARLFAEIYEQAVASCGITVQRTEQQWQNMLTVAELEQAEAAVVLENEVPAGYMLYKIKKDCFAVQELMAFSGAAKNRLLGYARGYVGQFRRFAWDAPMQDLTYLSLSGENAGTRLVPQLMLRVINTEAVLKSLRAADASLSGSMVLFVQDEFMPANNTLLRVNVADGCVSTETAVTAPDIMMDIAAFTQLYCGTFTVEALTQDGRICGTNPEAFVLLEKLFPQQVVFINEFF